VFVPAPRLADFPVATAVPAEEITKMKRIRVTRPKIWDVRAWDEVLPLGLLHYSTAGRAEQAGGSR
jgi:hypothetical protein